MLFSGVGTCLIFVTNAGVNVQAFAYGATIYATFINHVRRELVRVWWSMLHNGLSWEPRVRNITHLTICLGQRTMNN